MNRPMQEHTIDMDAKQEYLDPAAFSTFGKELATRLWPIFRTYCPQVPFEIFRDHTLMLAEQGLERRRLSVYTDSESGEVVGFATLRTIRIEADNARHLVMTGGCYLREAWRGQGKVTQFYLRHAAALTLTSLRERRQLWLFSLCGPATYHMICKRSQRVYPAPNQTTTPATERVYNQAKARFGYTSLPGRPYVIGGAMWRRAEAPHITRRWHSRSEPHVYYYLNVCGDYLEGQGLMAILPLGLSDFVFAIRGMVRESLTKLRRRAPRFTGEPHEPLRGTR